MRRNSDIAIRFITLCSTHSYTGYFNEIFTTCNKVDIIWKLFSQWLHWYKSQLHTTYLDWDTGCQLAMTKSLYSTIICDPIWENRPCTARDKKWDYDCIHIYVISTSSYQNLKRIGAVVSELWAKKYRSFITIVFAKNVIECVTKYKCYYSVYYQCHNWTHVCGNFCLWEWNMHEQIILLAKTYLRVLIKMKRTVELNGRSQ